MATKKTKSSMSFNEGDNNSLSRDLDSLGGKPINPVSFNRDMKPASGASRGKKTTGKSRDNSSSEQ